MSSLYVRDLVRDWCSQFSSSKFYDTINYAQDPKDPIWSTVNFLGGFNEQITYCRNMKESGSFDMIFFGKPGVGDRALLQAAELDMAYLMEQVDAAGRLQLLLTTPPEDYERSDGTPGFVVSLTVDYSYYH